MKSINHLFLNPFFVWKPAPCASNTSCLVAQSAQCSTLHIDVAAATLATNI